ncbi:3',5'-cyclic-nucleotide phosphodiesterase PDE1, partial [Ascoidea rubescens DSM 1968]
IKFDISVLGSSGGPLEINCCSYLIKTSNISYTSILSQNLINHFICIDAGSGYASFNKMISNENEFLFKNTSVNTNTNTNTDTNTDTNTTTTNKIIGKIHSNNLILNSYNDSLNFLDYTNCSLSTLNLNCTQLKLNPSQITSKLFDLIESYFITHPHLDHILALIINSAGFNQNSSNNYLSKKIYGSNFTINALKTHIFNGIIWPDLSKYDKLLQFIEINDEKNLNINLNSIFNIKPFSLNHGVVSDGSLNHQIYKSNCFFIQNNFNLNSILIFGDFEANSIKNGKIWDHASLLIYKNQLSGIIIECSTENLPDGVPLYGHMTPNNLFNEFISLNEKLQNLHKKNNTKITHQNSLNGLNILITHVKESYTQFDPRKKILNQLNNLNDKYQFGLKFTIIFPGVTYSI